MTKKEIKFFDDNYKQWMKNLKKGSSCIGITNCNICIFFKKEFNIISTYKCDFSLEKLKEYLKSYERIKKIEKLLK